MKKFFFTITALCVVSFMNAQITLGQLSDFEDGTTQGWSNGAASPNPPTNIPTGGPNGADDNFLEEISAGGSGPGSRLVIFNDEDEWTGNYTVTNATIELIIFDAKNAGTTDLSLRIGIEGGSDTSEMVTTEFVSLPSATTDWTEIVIPIRVSDFTVIDGANTVAEVLADVSDIRILSNPNLSYMGEAISGTLHVDNIRADAFLGVDENDLSDNLQLFPNPVQDKLTLNSTVTLDGYAIYSISGRLILQEALLSNSNIVDLSQLSAGMYLLQVNSGDNKVTKKIIKS